MESKQDALAIRQYRRVEWVAVVCQSADRSATILPNSPRCLTPVDSLSPFKMVRYGNKCEYFGCGRWSQMDKNISFFRFPVNDKERYEIATTLIVLDHKRIGNNSFFSYLLFLALFTLIENKLKYPHLLGFTPCNL